MSDRREIVTSVGRAFRSWRCRPPRAAVGTGWVVQWMLPRQDLPAGRRDQRSFSPRRREEPAPDAGSSPPGARSDPRR
jgi:hypothetical protein